MIDIGIIIHILILHFIGDFILQSDYIAKNKSSSNRILSIHVLLYTLILIVDCIFILLNPLWAVVNGILHFMIDYVTSRVTSQLWKQGDTHNFFVVIGFDQLLHGISLFGTYYLLTL